LQIALNQTDKVFKSYFSELSKLDKEDVTLLMDYYHEQSILLERVKSTLQKMKSGNDIKVDIDGYLLEEHFMNELNLSNILLKR
ncbi:lysogenic conversion protein, partial [Escherichia coli]|nr:lysogenic conversion protein [Escherichia coli]